MINRYELEERESRVDRKKLEILKTRIFRAQNTIDLGFFELMKTISEILNSKLYRLDNMIFKEFCEIKLNMSYKTVNGLLKIHEIVGKYPKQFTEKIVIEFGHRKMKTITYGIVRIENAIPISAKATSRVLKLVSKISPDMSSPEIDELVKNETLRLP